MDVILKRIHNEGEFLTLTLSDISFALEINLKFSREERGDCIFFDDLANFLNEEDEIIHTTGMNLTRNFSGVCVHSTNDHHAAYLSYICSHLSLNRILNYALSIRHDREYYYEDDIHVISQIFMTG